MLPDLVGGLRKGTCLQQCERGCCFVGEVKGLEALICGNEGKESKNDWRREDREFYHLCISAFITACKLFAAVLSMCFRVIYISMFDDRNVEC